MCDQKLRVWYNLRVPRDMFVVEVADIVEARLVLETLARYDEFLCNYNLASYAYNSGGLQVWNESKQDWVHWFDEEANDIHDYSLEEIRDRLFMPNFRRQLRLERNNERDI